MFPLAKGGLTKTPWSHHTPKFHLTITHVSRPQNHHSSPQPRSNQRPQTKCRNDAKKGVRAPCFSSAYAFTFHHRISRHTLSTHNKKQSMRTSNPVGSLANDETEIFLLLNSGPRLRQHLVRMACRGLLHRQNTSLLRKSVCIHGSGYDQHRAWKASSRGNTREKNKV